MSFQKNLKKLRHEIKGKNREKTIEAYEDILSESPEELSKSEDFFKLPLKNIFSIVSKVKFNDPDDERENKEIVEILQNITKNLIRFHNEEKETIFLLYYINLENVPLSYKEIFSILELFTNCPVLADYCNKYKEENQLVEVDYEFEIKKKRKQIHKLKKKLSQREIVKFPKIKEKPKDFEPDIFVACKEGKLQSLQWLLEKESGDRYGKDSNGDTPLHIACQFGQFMIVQYLMEVHYVDANVKGWYNVTPLHYACRGGYLQIVEYLIENGADIEAQDDNEETPLHYVSYSGYVDIVKLLLSKGANKYVKNKYDETPYDNAKTSEIKKLL